MDAGLNDMPVTTAINRLMERYGIKSMPQWWALPDWERAALWHYARIIGARYVRIYGNGTR